MPTVIADYVETWRHYHPDVQHELWRDRDLGWIPNRDLYDDARRLVVPDAVNQLRADIARYAILERHGGFYVDADTEALRDVWSALEGHDAWAAAEDTRWVGNTYLACTPHHPVAQALVERLSASVTKNSGSRPNKMTGPQYLTPIWHEFGCHVAPTAGWFPYSYRDVKRGLRKPGSYPDAYAVHHWQHTRDMLKQ